MIGKTIDIVGAAVLVVGPAYICVCISLDGGSWIHVLIGAFFMVGVSIMGLLARQMWIDEERKRRAR